MAAVVERTGMNPLENYETGMVCFQSREYGKAAQYFHDAGNYKDAKKWAYYCEAIDDMICNSMIIMRWKKRSTALCCWTIWNSGMRASGLNTAGDGNMKL